MKAKNQKKASKIVGVFLLFLSCNPEVDSSEKLELESYGVNKVTITDFKNKNDVYVLKNQDSIVDFLKVLSDNKSSPAKVPPKLLIKIDYPDSSTVLIYCGDYLKYKGQTYKMDNVPKILLTARAR